MLNKLRRLLSWKEQPRQLATAEDATAFLAELFTEHGLPVAIRDGWLWSNSCRFKGQARIFMKHGSPPQGAIQLDVDITTADGRTILESVAGIGATMHEAILNGLRAYAEGSFHVIFSALTGRHCSHCDIETWSIGGVTRRVFLGPITTRGVRNRENPKPNDWFPAAEAQIKALPLDQKLHWIRFYHAEIENRDPINEVLLDNEPSSLRDVFEKHTWPKSQGFYSVQLFIIVA